MTKAFQIALLLIVALMLGACETAKTIKETSKLDTFKSAHKKGDYKKIESAVVNCNTVDNACNQLHLIKGDACFRLGKLGKQGADVKKYFDCSIQHLGKGINLTKSWTLKELDLNEIQSHINLNESIRERQDMSKGDEAEQFTQQLLKSSERFISLSPKHVAAIYFNNSAKFTLLRTPILLAPEDPQVCSTIKQIIATLQIASQTSNETIYDANIAQLLSDVEGVKPALVGCQ